MPLRLARAKYRELTLLAGVTAAVLALAWILAHDGRQSVEDANQLYGRLSHGLDLIDQLQFDTQEVRRTLLYALHTNDANLQVEYAEQSRAADLRVQKLLTAASSLYARDRAFVEAIERAWRDYLVVRDEVIGWILEGSAGAGVTIDRTRGTASFTQVQTAVTRLKTRFAGDVALQVNEARARADRTTVRLMLIVVSVLVAAALGIALVHRRTTLEALLAIAAHKGSILRAVPDPIISTDVAGHIIELNDAAEEAFQIARADALGKQIEAVILPPGRAMMPELSGEPRLAGSLTPRIETIGRRADGTEFPIQFAAVTHGSAGARIRTVHVSDLTERHRIEDQLRRARDAAEAADRAKSEFLATVSHELRTPLAGIVGVADLLQKGDPTPAQRGLIRMLQSSATALMSLVNDILDYSRIEAGAIQLTAAPFALDECIEDALDTTADGAARKRLDMGYVIDDDVPALVVADQARVRQVLLNLLSNAIKFTDAGEVSVHVRSETAGSRCRIHVEVRDSGIGIPDKFQPSLFERFSQVDATATRRHGGAGLGLAISRGLSHLLGGSLAVESSEGHGSTFTFVFPAEPATAPVSGPPAGSLSGMRVRTYMGPGIVADHVRSILARWGVTVDAGADGGDGRQPAADGDADAIVVDGEALGGRLRAEALEYRALRAPTGMPILVMSRLGLPVTLLNPREYAITMPVRAKALYHALTSIAPQVTPPTRQDPPGTAADRGASGSPAVLLVEDNDANRRILLLMLQELGINADEATCGTDAVARALRGHYDLILMDVQMPDLDGLEAARQIRAERNDGAPVIIALTANVLGDEEARCLAAGMNGFLTKPLRLDTLATAIDRWLPRSV